MATACADAMLRLWALGLDQRLSFLHAARLGTGAGEGGGGGGPQMLTCCAFGASGSRLACTARDGTVFVLVRPGHGGERGMRTEGKGQEQVKKDKR